MYYKPEYEVIMQCYAYSRKQTLSAELTDETRDEVVRTTRKKKESSRATAWPEFNVIPGLATGQLLIPCL